LLGQYDEASHILHGDNIADADEREVWGWIEPNFRRAVKHLAELLCIESFTARKGLRGPAALETLEVALACTESLVQLAHESDLAHSIFPEDCVCSVSDKGPVYCKIAVLGTNADYARSFRQRVIRDRESRWRFVLHPQFDNHTETLAMYLDGSFRESFGMGYSDFVLAIITVINGCLPSPNRPSSIFVHREGVLNQLAGSGRERQAIERAIDGFSIFASKLLEEGRAVWNPKQENRAYRRGFYICPHETGLHLAFSPAMAQESLVQLVTWTPYKHLPPEWQTPATLSALDKLSHAAGEWFEKIVCKQMSDLGFVGQPAHTFVGNGQRRFQIPDHVGGIDFLGYHPDQRLLIIIEAKMVMTGLEARYWRDDLDEFVHRSGSYAERLRRKSAWIKENISIIASLLGYGPINAIGTAMITLYPCIAGQFIRDFPCVSLTEFLLDYEQYSRWPYQVVNPV